MRWKSGLTAIAVSALLMAMPLGNNAKAAVFVSVGAAPAYYYPAAPVVYAQPPVAYAPPPVAYAYPPQYVVQPAPVVYAAPAVVVAPVYIGGGWHHCCWH